METRVRSPYARHVNHSSIRFMTPVPPSLPGSPVSTSSRPTRLRTISVGVVTALFLLSTILIVVVLTTGGAVAASPSGSSGAGSVAAAEASPPVTSPFTLTVNPLVFTHGAGLASTVATASGATFTGNAVATFCVSASPGFTTVASVGSHPLALGATTFSNVAVTLSGGSFVVGGAGTYYLAATDYGSCAPASPSVTYTNYVTITVTNVAPGLTVGTSPTTAGSTDPLSGSGWDAGATVSVYLNQTPATLGGSPVPGAPLLGTFLTSAGGNLPADATFTVPTLAEGSYSLVAQETSGPAAAVSVGITASGSFTIEPAVTVTPFYFSGAAGSTLTVTGTGFYAGSTIAAALTASTSITVGSSDTTHNAVTVSSTGTFSASVMTATAIVATSTVGPQAVGVTTSPASSVSSFSDAVFVSTPNPGALGFSFSPSPVKPTAPISAEAWNFPAGATVTFYMGSVVLGSAAASSLGFAELSAAAVLPGMPAGSYSAVAADVAAGLYSTPHVVSVQASYTAVDPSGTVLGGEYLPSGGTVEVWSYGLIPGTPVAYTDSVLGGSIITANVSGTASLNVVIGSADYVTGEFLPASNGTLLFEYAPLYAFLPSPPTTGTVSTVGGPAGSISTYRAIGAATLNPASAISGTAYLGGSTHTFTASGLIPENAAVYPGTTFYYNIYMGVSLVSGQAGSSCTGTGGTGTTCYATAGTLTIVLTVPSATSVAVFSITYLGGSVASPVAEVAILISTPGASAGSGTLVVEASPGVGPYAIGKGLTVTGTPTYDLNISTSTGVVTVNPSVSGTTGSFAYPLAGYTNEPAGTYAVLLFIKTSAASATLAPASYSVSASLTLSASSGAPRASFTATPASLHADAYYDLYFGSQYVETVGPTAATGGYSPISVTVPEIPPATYTISLDPTGTTTPAVSASFTVTESTTITLFSGGADAVTAFPTELVQFTWTPTSAPVIPGSTDANGVTWGPVAVTVNLNSTPYTSFPGADSAGTLSGSFQMPNAPASSSYFVSLTWTQTGVCSSSAATCGAAGATTFSSYTDASAAFLQLVSGNGALLTGITPAQVAEITTAVNQTLEVPISELKAAVVSINDATANITTQFGTMTATLNAINATVTSVENGVVTLQTSFGYVNTSLKALGGAIASINGTLLAVTTSLGTITTTLNSVDATVTSTATSVSGLVGSVATIQTTLGTLTGQVTSVQNGIVTIQTDIGTLQTNVSNVGTSVSNAQNSVQNALYWEIAAVALLIVTLALTAALLGQARRRPPSPPSNGNPPSAGSPPPAKPSP